MSRRMTRLIWLSPKLLGLRSLPETQLSRPSVVTPPTLNSCDVRALVNGTGAFINMKQNPTPPGEILREEFLIPLGLTQKQLADHIGCDFKAINRIVNEKAQVTPKLAIKLAATFNTTPDFWLNAQKAIDIYKASRQIKRLPKSLLKKAG